MKSTIIEGLGIAGIAVTITLCSVMLTLTSLKEYSKMLEERNGGK